LWEALTGERPFAGSALADIRDSVLAGRRKELPARLPRRVRAVLAKGLALDPAERFESMDELLDELAPRRRRAWIAGGMAAAALTTTALALGAMRDTPPDPCAW